MLLLSYFSIKKKKKYEKMLRECERKLIAKGKAFMVKEERRRERERKLQSRKSSSAMISETDSYVREKVTFIGREKEEREN